MKKFFLFWIIVIISQLSFSQVYKGKECENLAAGADIIRFKEYSKAPVYIHFKEGHKMSVEQAIDYTKNFIKVNNSDFSLKSIQKNNNGLTYRYFQTINGYPVEFSAWNIHLKGNTVTALNGEILDNINVSTIFSISEESALQEALKHMKAEKYMWQDSDAEEFIKMFKEDETATYYPKGEKVIVPNKINFSDSEFRTAYKFNIFSQKPYDRKMVYIDAQTGKVLFDLPLIHGSDEVGDAFTQYSGEQKINTTYDGSKYILRDNTRGNGIRTLNCQNGTSYRNAVEFTDNDNIWNNVNEYLDQYATDAHFGSMKTYDYYLNIHNRSSIDGNGHRLWAYIHYDVDYYNAFWNGEVITYGDGNSSSRITPLTTLDICAHEITHGLTQYTANLIYWGESGALNESFSDIFAVSVEHHTIPELANWTIGEGIGSVMRSMQNPKMYSNPNTYQGDYWEFTDFDNGGVHINSGVFNYWYYLICEGGSGTNDFGNTYNVSGMGINNGELIAYKLLSEYLTASSGYEDAYFYGIEAAIEIFGLCSPEVKTVRDAFYAIGMTSEIYPAEAYADFYSIINQSCTAPFEVEFVNNSLNSDTYLWEFGDGNTSTERNPVHTYNALGEYNVKLTVSHDECGSASEFKQNYIIIDEDKPCVTIMEPSGTNLVEGCQGIIYDDGGPHQDYSTYCDSRLTIYSPGALYIVLDILEFNIAGCSNNPNEQCSCDYLAFHDGNSINSPMINSTRYCNNTGNPERIESTGEYLTIHFRSNNSLNLSGFKLQYNCVSGNNSPIADFSVGDRSSCSGLVAFTDNSDNSPTSWLWEFGDGSTSTEQNPIHQYVNNGDYTIKLTATNENGSNTKILNDYINIAMPEISYFNNIIDACSNETFLINIDIPGELLWYENINDETPVHTGNTWAHDPVISNTTYHVRESSSEILTYNVGNTNTHSGGSYINTSTENYYLVFDAYTNFVLKSVAVNASVEGERTIALRKSNGDIITQKVVNIPSGRSRVILDIDVPAGTDLQLTCLGTPNLYASSSGVSFPYTIENIVSIKHSSIPQPTSRYYFFYNWIIDTKQCVSEFSEVELLPVVCEAPTADFTADKVESCNGIISFTDNSTGSNIDTWLWNFGDGNTSTEQNPVHEYLENGVYTVQLTASNYTNSNQITKTDYIEIQRPNAPEVPEITACSDRRFDIELDFENTIHWHDDITNETPVHIGNSWNHAPISSERIYYVREVFENEDPNEEDCVSLFKEVKLEPVACIELTTPEFSADRETTCSGKINFYDNSTEYITTRLWDFGDGNTSTTKNPIHEYSENGTYTVKLTISNSQGSNSVEKEDFITVQKPEISPIDVSGITACDNINFEINLEREGTLQWYEDDNLVHNGNNWTHDPVDESVTYLVREAFAPQNPGGETCITNFTEVTLISSSCISVDNNTINNISIAPNPGYGSFEIFGLENFTEYNVVITDIHGKIIIEQKDRNIIDLTNCAEGVYFVKVSNNKIHKTIKLINQKGL